MLIQKPTIWLIKISPKKSQTYAMFTAECKSVGCINIHDFIISDLKEGYETTVGDKGVRLSGGQRQRIGIARALYNKPDVLVLDEATSALDDETEQAVMDAVNNLGRELTIVIIAHRLSTLSKADIVYRLEKGRLHSKGSYEEMCKISGD